ncbi:MAG: prepilin-type N-terminal cleavage/methylation domain-containing protein [bacterium]
MKRKSKITEAEQARYPRNGTSAAGKNRKSKIENQKLVNGFSLVEIIVGVVVVGIAFATLAVTLANMEGRFAVAETSLRATTLAQSYIELVRCNRFDENYSPPWSISLGPEEAGESDYDDIDDYAGYSNFSIEKFPGYSVSLRVFYVNPTISWEDSVGSQTNFKRIIATVSHSELESLSISTLMSSRYDVQ